MNIFKRNSKSTCCVLGCTNGYKNTDDTIKFYTFPGRWYEKERRQVWIDRVKKKNCRSSQWQPTSSDLICSAHFIGNRKSVDQSSPSYHPTIFPYCYKSLGIMINANRNCESRKFRGLFHRSRRILDKRGTNKEKSSVDDKKPEEDLRTLAETETYRDRVSESVEEDSSMFDVDKSDQSNDDAKENLSKNSKSPTINVWSREKLPLEFKEMLENINNCFKKRGNEEESNDNAFANYVADDLKNIENEEIKDKVKVQLLKVLIDGKKADRARRK